MRNRDRETETKTEKQKGLGQSDLVPLRVKNRAVKEEADKLIRGGDCMDVGRPAVDEVRVRVPYPLQHLQVERHVGDLFFCGVEGQAAIDPVLSEVTVHGENLWRTR